MNAVTKSRISRALKGRKWSPEQRRKFKATMADKRKHRIAPTKKKEAARVASRVAAFEKGFRSSLKQQLPLPLAMIPMERRDLVGDGLRRVTPKKPMLAPLHSIPDRDWARAWGMLHAMRLAYPKVSDEQLLMFLLVKVVV